MHIVDLGSGPAVVLIPGVQGRWEWMRPAVEALASSCRVITFSLADEPAAGAGVDPAAGFENFVTQVRDAIDERGVESAAICGVSYGGLVAAAFACEYPQRTDALILVSALPPDWQPDPRVRFYLRAPRLLSPIFCLASLRMYPEIAAAYGGYVAGAVPGIRHAWNVITHMFSPRRMAGRVTLLARAALASRIRDISAPTLLVTGEPSLDRIVPVAKTLAYERLCRDVQAKVIPRTGHIGLITRPDVFAQVVTEFVSNVAAERQFRPHDPRRQVG
ncbi:MAG: alpha/beta fold hydrolase [Vicinamibacterales bacterium]